MSIDTTRIGTTAAEIMEVIESAAANIGTEPVVGEVAVVVELSWPAVEDEHPGFTTVHYRCTDNRRWVQKGLFDEAARSVHSGEHESDDDED